MTEKRYRTAAHSRYTIYYHIVFCPKYRREIFEESVIEQATKEALGELAHYHEWIIEALEMDRDHVHLFLSVPPRYAPSEIVKLIKTWTYQHVYLKYPKIKKYLWGGKMWANGFYVSTISDNATREEIRRYVQGQKKRTESLSKQQRLFG